MAFLRYARANVVTPQLGGSEWDKIRVASGSKQMNRSLKAKAEDILGEEFIFLDTSSNLAKGLLLTEVFSLG